MDNMHSSRTSFWKRIAVSTTVIAMVFGLSANAWSQDWDRGRAPDNVGGKRGIKMATFNAYVGADFGPVLALDPSDPQYFNKLVAGVVAIHSQILQSDFEVRANELAKQIVRRD